MSVSRFLLPNMAEIADSDSPDPLSSTPPAATSPSPSALSTVSEHHSPIYQSDTPSSGLSPSPESPDPLENYLERRPQFVSNYPPENWVENRVAPLLRHLEGERNVERNVGNQYGLPSEIISEDSVDESEITSDSAPFGDESTNTDEYVDENAFDFGDELLHDSEDEESLFVNDHDNVDDDINPNGNNIYDLDVIFGANYPLQQRQHREPSQDTWPGADGESSDFESLPGMNRGGRVDDDDDADDDGDELVGMELEVEEIHAPRHHQEHRRRQPQPQPLPEVIDLTGDNDSPPHPPRPPHSAHLTPGRNFSHYLRRRRSQQRNTPPRLSRSDASYVGGRAFIDLTVDQDDEPPAAVMPPLRRDNLPRPPRHPPPIPPPIPHEPPNNRPQLGMLGHIQAIPLNGLQDLFRNMPVFQLMGRNFQPGNHRQDEDDLVIMGDRDLLRPPEPQGPIPDNMQLNYNAHPFVAQPGHGGAAPKPTHEPPKDARDGFTRNTGEDVVAICPSCEQELAYDPDGDEDGPPPAKRARTKKATAEHHFWAVKACGHVYCKKCFDNRKPTGKNPVPVGFRPDPNGAKNKMLCAVEDCDSDVSAKAAWVGIFM
ncbi:hypothetical protein F4819DRAFT_453198 [Hypoxylon fuscum]|nr:hypothetical protein F4819DRAFT_453198 [Hypoxylon fuscum]